ncbi:hypothetical protein JQC91_12765 [Jannaschia sp. Os4]|uniref:hypothetical protein n=1 Tax=Jannaschia sp. Os4 TaxID=2807617 RepID=UPI001939D40C|nr:hypothetical protein [Jannaschia sp. Os4]MBM2577172.1 hypothetical protein [Jannaschia sp. Os4]
MTIITRRRLGAMLGGAALVAGCSNASDPSIAGTELPGMGDFRLGFNVVVTDKIKRIPPSRPAEPADWERVMKSEVQKRFGVYQGTETFHVALALDGYALAPPGIPVVLTPKSILVATANLWSEREGRKVLGPEQLSVFEGAESLLLGTGLIKGADEQMVTLARNMAAKVQRWILREGRDLLDAPPA